MIIFDNYTEPTYRINDDKGVIVARSEIMLNLFYYLNHLAKLPTTVLLRGETGTGKELFAKALHYNSNDSRVQGNFVAVNCAGIPTELLESDLFGHMKGSFTGAYRNSEGKFQHAQGGTIFLDEIGDMSLKLQAKILRVLQERQITRVGSNHPEEIDVRVVTATNKDLEQEVRDGNFRRDLYYRLNVVPIRIPSLRERRDDIPLIAEYLVKKFNAVYGVELTGLSSSAQEKLKRHDWEGNVRELENIVEKAFVLGTRGEITGEEIRFGYEIPERIVVTPRVEVPEPTIITSIQEYAEEPTIPLITDLEPAGKPWYADGVLPLFPVEICQLEGAKGLQTVSRNIANDKAFFTVNVGAARRILTYVTKKNMGLLFKEKTHDYELLEQRISRNEFNPLTEQPFMFATCQEISGDTNTQSINNRTRTIAKRLNLYVVGLKHPAYAIAENHITELLAKDPLVELRVDNFRKQMLDSYERFVQWKPS